MNASAKMMLINGRNKRRRVGVEYEDWSPADAAGRGSKTYNYGGNGQGGQRSGSSPFNWGGHVPESRFRDRRGRENYDDGRFSPMRGESDTWIEDRGGGGARSEYQERAYGGYGPDMPRYLDWSAARSWHDPYIHGRENGMNMIGFSDNQDFRGTGMDASYPMRNEMEYKRGGAEMGWSNSGRMPELNRQTAEEWVQAMENEDGTRGPHFTMEQTNQIRGQMGIDCDPTKFWIAVNMMYSDYCKVLKKYGVGDKIDVYACLAQAFLDDKDANPEKLERYYQYIVKH